MSELTSVEQHKPFDYSQLDEHTADFLRQRELNMRNIVGNAYTELGRELKKAQEHLARQGSKYNGVFEKWYTFLGFKKVTVYNLINRYNLVQNLNEVEKLRMIEELPVSLTYEISKPSAEDTPAKAQAKAEVLAGEIKTLKEYRERIKQLEKELEQEKRRTRQANEEKEEAEQRARFAEQKLEEEKRKPPKVEVRTEYIKVEDTEAREKLRQYEERFGSLDIYDENVIRIKSETEVIGSALAFAEDVRQFVKKYAFLENYAAEFPVMNESAKREYVGAINVMLKFMTKLHQLMENRRYAEVIDIH